MEGTRLKGERVEFWDREPRGCEPSPLGPRATAHTRDPQRSALYAGRLVAYLAILVSMIAVDVVFYSQAMVATWFAFGAFVTIIGEGQRRRATGSSRSSGSQSPIGRMRTRWRSSDVRYRRNGG